MNAYGDQHHIELYSGGTKVREWYSTGKVFSEENSDGFYFKDSESKLLVRVTGDVVVTPVKEIPKTVTGGQYKEIPPDVDAGELIKGKADPFESTNAL